MIALKMIALVLSLGVDTLMVSTLLGFTHISSKVKIAFIFSCAEALMPLIGLFIGQGVGRLMGNWASLVGGITLLVVAVWIIFFEDDDEDGKLERNLVGWTLFATALSISVDELVVGFSIGLMGVPVEWTIILIAIQAFAFTILGLTFGGKLKRYLGEWAEKSAGVVLGLLGIWILIDAGVRMVHR